MAGGRRQPDPDRRGTVYRSRPRLWPRRGSSAGRPPAPSAPSGSGVTRLDPPPYAGSAHNPDPYGPQPGGPPLGGGRSGGPSPYGTAIPSGAQVLPGQGRSGGHGGDGSYSGGGDGGGRGGFGGKDGYDGGGGLGPGVGARRPRPRLRFRWVALAVVVLLVVYPLALFWVAWSHLGKVAATPTGDRPAVTPGRTYLVVGSDSRSALTPAERRRLGTGKVVGSRTDTVMLLHVPAGGGPTVLISVPRDSYVSIPGHRKNKINAAYAFGGPQLLMQTVEGATGLHIDEYVETGLLGYADLVDAVGGVTVCVKKPINDAKAHINLKAGCQVFDGTTALGYARARYSDPRGDLGRVERQRQVLAAIAGKTLSPSVVTLPWRSFPAASAGGNALVVADGTSPWGLVSFVLAMRDVAGGGGLSLTVPISNPNLSTPAGSAVQWNSTQAKALFADLRRDDTEAVRPIAQAQQKATTG